MIIDGKYYDDKEPFGKDALALKLQRELKRHFDIMRAKHEVMIFIHPGKERVGMSSMGIKIADLVEGTK